MIASTEDGLYSTDDGGESWDPFQGPPGLVAWTTGGIFVIDAYGKVLGADGGTLKPAGRTGQLPVALTGRDEQLFIATDQGEILSSADGGSSWATVTPG